MELKSVKTLKEASSIDEAEQLIAAGWTLLAIVPTVRPNGWSLPCYVLGKGAGRPELPKGLMGAAV